MTSPERNVLSASISTTNAARLLALVLCATAAGQAPPDWLLASTQPEFDSPTQIGITTDTDRGRAVLFCARPPYYAAPGLAATWEWNGAQWLRMRPTTSPTNPGPLAYDPLRRRVILVAHDPNRALEHWEWDGLDWTRRFPAQLPTARQFYAVAFDQARDRLVLFGGDDPPNYCQLGDTWEWDGTTWQQVAVTGPQGRAGHAMTYDAARQRVVLFGGNWGCGAGNYRDTWEWNGASWTQRNTVVRPQALFGHAMAWDPGRQRVVLYGDWYDNGTAVWHYGETWEWDGTVWTQHSPGSRPGSRQRHVMTHDPILGEMLLFGGGNSQTWSWDGVTWTRRGDGDPPVGSMLTWDAGRSRILACGGGSTAPNAPPLALYEWDGASFTLVPSSPSSPSSRGNFAFAYDRVRQRAVLFGGLREGPVFLADTWEWDGVAWSQRLPATGPPARTGVRMVFDEARQRMVLFGGSSGTTVTYFGDTWTWDGTSWMQQSTPVAPSPRRDHAMAFDVTAQEVVLFGGYDATTTFGDTWLWDGSSWSQALPASNPSVVGHSMAFDRLRGRTVLFGYVNVIPRVPETWEWDGLDWTQTSPATHPSWRSGANLAFDERHQHLVLWGGYAGIYLDELWRYGALQPAAVQSLGPGCVGGAGTPELVSTMPTLGSRAQAVDVHRLPAGAPSLIGFSFGAQSLPLGGGCSLYLQNPIVPVFVLANAGGFVSLPFSLPHDLALRGLTLNVQAAALDPQGPVLGLVLSNAVSLLMGD